MEKMKKFLVSESTWGSPSAKGTCIYYDEFPTKEEAYAYAEEQEKKYARDAEEHPDHCWEVIVYSPDEWRYNEERGEYIILV
jgi:hypothetical protein